MIVYSAKSAVTTVLSMMYDGIFHRRPGAPDHTVNVYDFQLALG
jgi:hypothetical protein